MKKFDAVILDLDGTLLDTLEELKDAMNKVLHEAGLKTLTRAEARPMVGDGSREFMRMALPESMRTDKIIDDMVQRYRNNRGWHRVGGLAKPYEGIEGLLKKLESAKIKIAVLSNKTDDAAKRTIAEFFPGTPFDAVYGQREGVPAKPHPAGILNILAELGVTADRTLMVGDGDADCMSAIAAGVVYAAALWGYRTREELESVGAYAFYDSVQELEEYIFGK